MKTRRIDTPNGRIAAHELAGRGPAAVLIHGNSSSSRAFSKQLNGPLGERFRLVAIDLPGHGASDDKKDPALYSLRNQTRSLRAAIDALGLADAHFVGWSMGGHFSLELAPDLPKARGFFIFGTPPLALPPAMALAFLPHPAMGAGFAETIGRAQAEAYVASFFAPGFADIAPFFVDDALRADGQARAGIRRRRVLRRNHYRPRSQGAAAPWCTAPGTSWSTARISPRSLCQRCGAGPCRRSPAPVMRRNGRRRRLSTRSSRRSSTRRREEASPLAITTLQAEFYDVVLRIRSSEGRC